MEEEETEVLSSGGRTESIEEEEVNEENNILKFLDSMDSYLVLVDSLSSTLRQGWLELASARHSMGASRISSALFDLKHHTAATFLEIKDQDVVAGSATKQSELTLLKWGSPVYRKLCSGEEKIESCYRGNLIIAHIFGNGVSPSILVCRIFDRLCHPLWLFLALEAPLLSSSCCLVPLMFVKKKKEKEIQEKRLEAEGNESPLTIDNQVQKERSKSLSMFGGLVSPKLRATQLSLETALETLVEISNMRSSMLCAYDQAQKKMKNTIC